MNVLVTGGAGFVGSHLVEGLLAAGHEVRVLDDFATGRRETLRPHLGGIDLIEGSILDGDLLARAMAGIEIVFHEAALASIPRSVRSPLASNAVNVTGTLNVLIAARDAGVRRLIYAGSSSAYGAAPGGALVETMPPQPMSPYAVAKLAGEQYCRIFTQLYGLETVALRYFNIFGPRQDPQSEYAAVIPRFITALLDGRALTIYGDGCQSRDFTYIENVVAANLLAMTAAKAPGEVFNIGCGRQTSLNELAGQLGEITGREPQVVYLPARRGDVAHSLAHIGKARKLLSYEPRVAVGTGLRWTWEHFAAEYSPTAPTPARDPAVVPAV